jgi:hypothetical protein
MLTELTEVYADVLYVATTLRPPLSPQRSQANERFTESEAERRSLPSRPVGTRVWQAARRACRRIERLIVDAAAVRHGRKGVAWGKMSLR